MGVVVDVSCFLARAAPRLYTGSGVLVDSMGDTIADLELPWEVLPSSIVLAAPGSLLGWGKNSIEIRSTESGALEGTFKHRRATRLRYLCSHRNKVFFASIKSSSSCQVFYPFPSSLVDVS